MARLPIRALCAALISLSIAALPSLSVAEEAGSGDPASRIIAMEWAQLETLLSLGVTPVGAADAGGYREFVVAPQLPDAVEEVGSRREPNFEEMTRLDPDLILSHAHLQPLADKLAAIGPVEEVTFNGTGRDAYAAAIEGTRRIGELTGRISQAESLVSKAETSLGSDAQRIAEAGLADRPVYVVRIIGPNVLRVHGETSIADHVLDRLDLSNAYQGGVSEWGFATIEPSQLAENADATILVVGPVSDAEMAAVFDTPLGKAIPAVRAGRVEALPAVWTFGGLASAMRMGDAIAAAMTRPDAEAKPGAQN